MTRRRVVVLGSTGSIGTQALDVVRTHADRFEVVGLAARSDGDRLAAQAQAFGVDELAVADPVAAARLRDALPTARVRSGLDGVAELAALASADVVLNGVVGSQGLLPTLAALEAGHTVALANKESLIVGGPLVVRAADGRPDAIVPVDSEHSALAQCLRGGARHEVARLVLTASGGPFRGRGRDDLVGVTPDDALAHPTWDMGPVITVNSATLMNKGLELIEAHLLFAVPWDALDVVVHPQSVVHSMVEFIDGSTLAQLSPPDMRLPIQLALGWPRRLPHAPATLDWGRATQLQFEPVDRDTFRLLSIAEEAGRLGGTFPAVLNAANEQAVAAFLDGRIGFLDIDRVVEQVLDRHRGHGQGTNFTLGDVLHAESWARACADELCRATAR
ncbi:MAG: 1-deoxy-D-xylulose-5-phosphate reductoisomerase [Actinobacteria bacterium]|nr:1-deoxy-D-xylulose-5-phosphate reductoisomerase [Actinomycetota bacterium]